MRDLNTALIQTGLAKGTGAVLELGLPIILVGLTSSYEFGQGILIVTWVSALGLGACLGFEVSLIRLTAKYTARSIASRAVACLAHARLRALSVAAFLGIALAAAPHLLDSNIVDTWPLWSLGGLSVPVVTNLTITCSSIRGTGRVSYAETLLMVARPLIWIVLAGALVLSPIDVSGSTSVVGAFLLSCLVCTVFARPRHEQAAQSASRIGPRLQRSWNHISLPMMGASLAVLVMRQGDILIVGAFEDPEAVASYIILVRLASAVSFGLMVATPVLAPRISLLFSKGKLKQLQRDLRQAALPTSAIAITIAFVFIIFPDAVMRGAGVHHERGVMVLRILCIGQLANAMAGPVLFMLNMTGHQRRAVGILGQGSGIALLSYFTLVPGFGILGAAIGSSLSMAYWNIRMMQTGSVELKLHTGIRSILVR